VKRSHIAIALMAAAAFSSTASGAFFIEESGIIGTERGQMGKFQPYDAQGKATFAVPSAGMEPKQARYKDAELLVDLAYTPVTQHGSGEPAIVPGYGDEIPFDSAMSMILPTGWQVYKAKDFDKKSLPLVISFSGGRTWPDVLKQVGDRYELHFHIDWYDHTIMLSKGRKSMAMKASQMAVIPEPARPAKPITPSTSSSAVSTAAAATSFAATAPTIVAPAKPGLGGAAVMPASTTPATVQAAGFTKTVIKGGEAVSSAPAVSAPVTPAATTASAVAAAAGKNNFAPTPAAKPVLPAPVVAVAPPKPVEPPIPVWFVSAKDRTIREALKSWATIANWTFEPEHWAVTVDIPITAGAPFSGDFKTAVRQLIATTELGDTPLQPCFYTNRVVRVVPINQVCDQMSAR
jgi:hypothetical protein